MIAYCVKIERREGTAFKCLLVYKLILPKTENRSLVVVTKGSRNFPLNFIYLQD
jgi:hypothetical protein